MAKEERKSIIVGRALVEISNPDKPLFTNPKITKEELIYYYIKVAPLILPKIKDRPLSMLRYPDGISKEGFFQKNVPDYFPKRIKTVSIKKKGSDNMFMVLCNDRWTLAYLANQACITPHVWLSRKDKLDCPDRMIFDLDPSKGVDFKGIKEAARDLKDLLENEFKLKTFVMTTGSRGLHIVVPIKRSQNFKTVRGFAREIAERLSDKNPDKYTIELRVAKRGKRIFIDYLRNGFAQTTVAPYAVRALKGAPIAMPIFWSELSSLKSASDYHLGNIDKRLLEDPWKNMEKSAKALRRKK